MSIPVLVLVVVIYLLVIGYLGFRGYKATKTTSDYLLAGRKVHPYIMALSYGAAFISTSAIVGFGGAAAVYGMGLLWLTFLNIFVGIFIAFAVFGKRVRSMGYRLQAHTFPDLLGKRYNSRFIQVVAGLIIVFFMPLYAAAVLIAAARYIEATFVGIGFEAAVAVFAVVIAAYVIAGGLKGVMYIDALQGSVMIAGMVILVLFTYGRLGGFTESHKKLDQLPNEIESAFSNHLPTLREYAPAGLDENGLVEWFAGRAEEWTQTASMEATDREAFLVEHPETKAVGELLDEYPMLRNQQVILRLQKSGFRGWTRMPEAGSPFFYVLLTSIILGVGIGVLAQPQLAVRFMTVKSSRELNRAVLVGGLFIMIMVGTPYVTGNLSNAWFSRPENGGLISLAVVPGGNIDLIIPTFINRALPAWFGLLFMLCLLSAAMSTLSSQFHSMGASIGRDIFERGILNKERHAITMLVTRIGVMLSIIATVILAFSLPGSIVAVATAMFFGLCASAFLPLYIGGLFWRGMTRAGAIAGLCSGFGISLFWMLFVHMPRAQLPALLANVLFNRSTLLPEPILGVHWNWVDALVVALPFSTVLSIVVSLVTRKEQDDHLDRCFGK